MSYKNWNDDLEALSWEQMVEIGTFQTLLAGLKGIQYALQSQRTQGVNLLGDLTLTGGIFSETDRFPEKRAFIPIQYGDWPNKFEQVRTALNYKVPDVAQTNKDLASNATNYQSSQSQNTKFQKGPGSDDDGTKCITSQDERTRFERSMKSYYTGIADMENQLKGSILTRRTFESRFSAHWS